MMLTVTLIVGYLAITFFAGSMSIATKQALAKGLFLAALIIAAVAAGISWRASRAATRIGGNVPPDTVE